MPSIIDASPFPWERPEAQELHRTLVSLYPTEPRATFVATTAGIPPKELPSGLPVLELWRKILELASAKAATQHLVAFVRDQNRKNPTYAFLEALLKDVPVAVSLEPRRDNGSAVFLSGNDTPTEQEALLFRDDLSLLVGRVPAFIATLKKMMELAPAVCLLRVTAGSVSGVGTGFRIGDNLVLTNHHVLFPQGKKATEVIAEFGFETDARDAALPSKSLPCDCGSIITDEADDWGVIRVTEGLEPTWPRVILSPAVPPVLGESVFTLQHPRGSRKRLGFIRSTVTNFDERVVHYLTDAQPGSSGAPVFNAQGELIALHHAGGTPQEVAGKMPLMKNEGIRIRRIDEGLQRKGILP
ncbi:trypsin-like peptidase domain-containing protein [Hyalangium versicolor]|uniref:trypsin-like peptidase domain-containing protein n=1 Tax=Hyalangium versicolor TaxID=2861190 RepID=UPI001CCA0677|nr:trypsin-like peptidase domain-containing protein [Hyalangium versicolor]